MGNAHTLGSGTGRLDVDGVQVALLREATVARRVGLVRSLSDTTMSLAWRAIRSAHPNAGEREVALAFVAIHYGQDLADRLRAYLSDGS